MTDGRSTPGKLIGYFKNHDALIEIPDGFLREKWKRISQVYKVQTKLESK